MTTGIYELAKFMHNEYEKAAKIFQWKTQKNCQVEWIDLPQANKDTMMFVAERVIDYFAGGEVPDSPDSSKPDFSNGIKGRTQRLGSESGKERDGTPKPSTDVEVSKYKLATGEVVTMYEGKRPKPSKKECD